MFDLAFQLAPPCSVYRCLFRRLRSRSTTPSAESVAPTTSPSSVRPCATASSVCPLLLLLAADAVPGHFLLRLLPCTLPLSSRAKPWSRRVPSCILPCRICIRHRVSDRHGIFPYFASPALNRLARRALCLRVRPVCWLLSSVMFRNAIGHPSHPVAFSFHDCGCWIYIPDVISVVPPDPINSLVLPTFVSNKYATCLLYPSHHYLGFKTPVVL